MKDLKILEFTKGKGPDAITEIVILGPKVRCAVTLWSKENPMVINGKIPEVNVDFDKYTNWDWESEFDGLVNAGFISVALHDVPRLAKGFEVLARDMKMGILMQIVGLLKQHMRTSGGPNWTIRDVAIDLQLGANSLYQVALLAQDIDWSQYPHINSAPEAINDMIEELSKFSGLLDGLADHFPSPLKDQDNDPTE